MKKYEDLPSEVVEYLENVEQEHYKQKETIEKMVPNLEKFEELMLEKQKLEEDRLCKICMEAEICCVFIPCGHAVCCDVCIGEIQMNCSICRVAIERPLKVYFS